MTINQAKRLKSGSSFWSPSTTDPSGYRLQVVTAVSANGLIAFDEHGYRAAWIYSDRNSWAGTTLIKPEGASEPEFLIQYLKNINQLF